MTETQADQTRHWSRDWRLWVGIGVTAACLWLAMRNVPLADVRQAMMGANLWLLLAISIPGHVGATVVRALRWRHLAAPVAPMTRGQLYRAQSLGFLVNNLLPLRVGELARTWYLARETRSSVAAILGTVVVERVLDVVCVLAIAAGALSWLGARATDGGILAQGARLMLPAAALPVLGLAALRFAPDRITQLAVFTIRPFSKALAESVSELLGRFTEGLGSISGGLHLFWIVFHSLTLWLVASILPFLAGIWAFDLSLGGAVDTIVSSGMLLAAVGMAVALPSAPGFIGPYQLAFTAVLVPLGVDTATALALGLVVWFVFWVTLILQGLIVLRGSPGRLLELARSPGKDPTAASR